MSNRKLSKTFVDALKLTNGVLNPILERVKSDHTLDLQIRNGYINIYYRGGNILWVKELPKMNGFEFRFNPKYGKVYPGIPPANIYNFIGKSINSSTNVSSWLAAIPYLKDIMDTWFGKHPKEEREFQQLIVRDNNYSSVSNATDYFILDIEYDNRKGNSTAKGARFDLLAFQWDSDGTSRKLTAKTRPRLCCIEMKYGDGALTGKAGLNVHYDDFCTFAKIPANISELKTEALEIFEQKRELGLIEGLSGNKNKLQHLDAEIDFIVLIANHDPEKSNFHNGLNTIKNSIAKCPNGVNIKVCESNNMGYGLYKEKVFPLNNYLTPKLMVHKNSLLDGK